MKISAVIHTYNSAETLEKALRSISWADEMILVDMQSTDRTIEIARNFTDHIFSAPKVLRVDGIRNEYNAKANHEWIFVLDSDEYLADDAQQEVDRLIAHHAKQYDAFAIPRFNYIAGQFMKGTGWYPDHQIRLFRKGTVQWKDAIHISPDVTTGKHRLMELVPPDCIHIHHLNYRTLRQFIQKQLQYALTESYSTDSRDFDFAKYIASAHEQLLSREDPELDGDLSHALSVLMAWDSVVRGLIHWDSLDPRPPLGTASTLPLSTERVPRMRIKFSKWLLRHYPFHSFLRTCREKYRRLFVKSKMS